MYTPIGPLSFVIAQNLQKPIQANNHLTFKIEHHFNMKYLKISLLIFLFLNTFNYLYSAELYFVDMKKFLIKAKLVKALKSI